MTILTPSSGRQDVLWDGADAVSTGQYGRDPTPHPYSPAGNLWYFTGRQYDPEIGSYHYRARQYHPTLGQFMSRDPIGPWGDAGSLGNAYAYVGNNPGSARDPSGLCPMCIGAVVGAAAGALLETGLYSYEVTSSGSGWDHRVARERIKFGLIAGAGIGATGGLGASIVGGVAAGGASAATVFGATVGVGAVEGVAGQAIVELASEGELSGNLQTYAEQAVIGATTAGIAFGAGTAWKSLGRLDRAVDDVHSPAPSAVKPGAIKENVGPYTNTGALAPEAIADSVEIPLRGGIKNPRVLEVLTSDGSAASDWGKFATRKWYESPTGTYQPHFYLNRVTGKVSYEVDYKSVLHPKSKFPKGGV